MIPASKLALAELKEFNIYYYLHRGQAAVAAATTNGHHRKRANLSAHFVIKQSSFRFFDEMKEYILDFNEFNFLSYGKGDTMAVAGVANDGGTAIDKSSLVLRARW